MYASDLMLLLNNLLGEGILLNEILYSDLTMYYIIYYLLNVQKQCSLTLSKNFFLKKHKHGVGPFKLLTVNKIL